MVWPQTQNNFIGFKLLFTTVREAQKQQLKQPQTPILFWPSNILAMAVISREGLSFEE